MALSFLIFVALNQEPIDIYSALSESAKGAVLEYRQVVDSNLKLIRRTYLPNSKHYIVDDLQVSPNRAYVLVYGRSSSSTKSCSWILTSKSMKLVETLALETPSSKPFWISSKTLCFSWTSVPHRSLKIAFEKGVSVKKAYVSEIPYLLPLAVHSRMASATLNDRGLAPPPGLHSFPGFLATRFANHKGPSIVTKRGDLIFTTVATSSQMQASRLVSYSKIRNHWDEKFIGMATGSPMLIFKHAVLGILSTLSSGSELEIISTNNFDSLGKFKADAADIP